MDSPYPYGLKAQPPAQEKVSIVNGFGYVFHVTQINLHITTVETFLFSGLLYSFLKRIVIFVCSISNASPVAPPWLTSQSSS